MLITIGKALRPWGVKGEIKIEPITDFPDRFKRITRVHMVSPSGKEIVCPVKSARYTGGAPLLLLDGYASPEKSKRFSNWLVKIPEEEAAPLPEGSYYWFELIGMEVASEEGKRLGRITDVFRTGSNDVYVMKRGKKETYIPATAEIIRQVDKKSKKMIIHIIDGLLD